MKYEVDDFEVYIDPRLNFEGDEIIIDLENFFFLKRLTQKDYLYKLRTKEFEEIIMISSNSFLNLLVFRSFKFFFFFMLIIVNPLHNTDNDR